MNDMPSFADAARGLARNPLGIIALFIVLVYGFASLVTAFTGSLTSSERMPLIYFLVAFPVLVLGVFGWLVSSHPEKLYGPSDFRNEDNYVTLVASLTAASARRADGQASEANIDIKRITQTAKSIASEVPPSSDNIVLWVDDRPENNVFERRAFESVGIKFILARSTSEALELLSKAHFSAIISDMGRREGPREGYVLLDQIRRTGIKTPFFIYASSNLTEHKVEAAQHGAQGSTNMPEELIEMVTQAIRKRPSS